MNTSKAGTETGKLPYEAPRLITHGSVEKLTMASGDPVADWFFGTPGNETAVDDGSYS